MMKHMMHHLCLQASDDVAENKYRQNVMGKVTSSQINEFKTVTVMFNLTSIDPIHSLMM